MSIPLGVVVRRQPGASRWAKWVWRATAVLPGAGPATWKVLAEDGGITDYHAATVPLQLHRADTEAYKVGLSSHPPRVWVVLRRAETPTGPHEYDVHVVTASAYEAQDYLDAGDDLVEAVEAPPGLVAFIRDFVDRHHVEEVFVKRQRTPHMRERVEDGIGDPRVRQLSDVYRAPRRHDVNGFDDGRQADGADGEDEAHASDDGTGRTLH